MLPWNSQKTLYFLVSARYLVTSQDLTLIWIFFLQNVAAMPYITYINSRFRVVNRRRPFTSINFFFLVLCRSSSSSTENSKLNLVTECVSAFKHLFNPFLSRVLGGVSDSDSERVGKLNTENHTKRRFSRCYFQDIFVHRPSNMKILHTFNQMRLNVKPQKSRKSLCYGWSEILRSGTQTSTEMFKKLSERKINVSIFFALFNAHTQPQLNKKGVSSALVFFSASQRVERIVSGNG